MRSGKKAKVEGNLIVDNLFSQERCVIDMATEYGWKGLQCWYWEVYSNGDMYIRNGSTNYIRKEYENKDGDGKHWDYLKEKETYYYHEDRNGDGKDERYSDWYYEYIYNNNGNDHPTVSGDGANLSGGGLNDQIYNHDAKNVKISGSSGNDYISNSGDDANINGGTGNDYVSNSGDKVTIDGGADKDTISNSGDSANIDGGADNDDIYNSGDKVTIIGGNGEGCDSVCNDGDSVEISTGAGMDSIVNNGSTITIDAGVGNDTIHSTGDSVTIDGGAGDDSIYNGGDSVTIIGGNGEGCDSVCNDGDSVEISTGAGMDSIVNNGSTITIDAGVGNDTIHSTGDSVTIDGGAGNDSIVNTVFAPFAKGGVNVTINAVEGKNTVRNGYFEGNIESHGSSYSFKFEGDHYGGDFVTIKVGAEGNVVQNHGGSHVTVDATSGGKNLISLSGGGHDISVKAGDGNDSIIAYTPERHGNHYLKPEYIANDEYSSGSDVMIETGNGNNVVNLANTWSYVTVKGGNKADFIVNAGSNNLIEGKEGNDYIRNQGNDAFILGGDDGDVIENFGSRVYIQGDNQEGKTSHKVGDYISTDLGSNVSIEAGESDDTINVFHDVYASILGGTGNDYLTLQRMSMNDVGKIQVGGIKAVFTFLGGVRGLPLPTDLEGVVKDSVGIIESGFTQFLNVLGFKTEKEVTFNIEGLDKVIAVRDAYEQLAKVLDYKKSLLTATSTINGGAGDDTIVSDGVGSRVFEYKTGDGNDIIYNFALENKYDVMPTLHITEGLIKEVELDGSDVIFKVDKGSIRLVDALGKKFNLREGDGYTTTRSYGINDITGGVVCSIFGSNEDETLQDNVGINRVNNDEVIGTINEVYIYGGGGHDILHANNKNSSLIGGYGDDLLLGGDGMDFLQDNDPDYVYSDGGSDKLYGGAGWDVISAHGKDEICGGTGNDDIYLNKGSNNVILYKNGDGFDQIHCEQSNSATDTVRIDNGKGAYYKEIVGNDVIIRVGTGGMILFGAAFKSPVIEGVLQSSTFKVNDDNDNHVTVPDDVETVDTSDRTTPVTLTTGESTKEVISNDNDLTLVNHSEGLTLSCPAVEDSAEPPAVAGNDISNYAPNVNVDLIESNGNNRIYNYSYEESYYDNEKQKRVYTGKIISPDNTTIKTGKGNDEISNCGASVSINAGDGDNYVSNYSYEQSIYDDEKKEWVYTGKIISPDNTTIKTGKGNDYISNTGSNLSIIAGEGDNTISNSGFKVTINAGDGDNYVDNYGSKVSITSGKGNDTIHNNGGASVLINVGDGNNIVGNYSKEEYIYDDEKQEWVGTGKIISPDNTTIKTGKGNDEIYNDGSKVSINAGKGNDTISNTGSNLSIIAGEGDNTISNSGSNVSIISGKGNDTINNSGSKVSIDAGTGNDTIYNNGINVTVNGGAGNDLVTWNKNLTYVYSSGNDTIENFNSRAYLVIDGKYEVKKSTDTNTVIVNVDGKGSLTLTKCRTDKINIVSSISDAPKAKSVYNIKNGVKVNGTSGMDIVQNGGDWDYDLDKPIGGDNTTLITGKGDDYIDNYGSFVTIDAGKGDDFIENEPYANNVSVNGGAGNDYIVHYVHFFNEQKQESKATLSPDNSTVDGGDGDDTLYASSNYGSINGGKGDDSIRSRWCHDVTILGGEGNDKIFNDGGDISNITYSGERFVAHVGSDFVTIDGGKGADFIKNSGTNISINGGDGNDSIYNTGEGEDSLAHNDAKNVTIVGGAGKDYIYNEGAKVSIDAGMDNDTLIGGTGNATLTGGAGADVFVHTAGQNVIADFTAGQDKIQIASGKISKTSLKGSDVLFTIGKGSLTVKNAKGKTISLLDSAGKASSTVVGAQALTNSNKANVTIGADMGFVDSSKRTKAISITGNSLANTISGGIKNDSIYGADGNDSILGNAGNDKLYGDAGNDILLGGKGNDSLWGGAGNDSLWGDAGKDTFFYTANEGTDRIFDYEAGDMLKILNADGNDGSFKSSKFSGGDLTLTINGGGKIIFDDVAFTTKFNINGSSYNISGSKLVKK